MAVYGGVPMDPQERALKAGVDIVVATPGRLLDHMRSGAVNFDELEVLVLDEADRMMDMGFWPDVRRIVAALPVRRAPDDAVLGDDAGGSDALRATRSCATPKFVQVGSQRGPARRITHEAQNVPAGEKAAVARQVPAPRARVGDRVRAARRSGAIVLRGGSPPAGCTP